MNVIRTLHKYAVGRHNLVNYMKDIPNCTTDVFRTIALQHRKLFSNNPQLSDGERLIGQKLKDCFPQAKAIKVTDISGGCGDMYEVHVESKDFAGKRTVQQHKLVTNALKDEVTKMHGLRIFTSVPS